MELNEVLTTQELLIWEQNLIDQQREFITCRIENRTLNRVADEVEKFESALARLLRQYAE